MWSTSLESQADLAHERYAELRAKAAVWHHHRKHAATLAERRPVLALTAWSGRMMAGFGSRLMATGERWQQRAALRRRLVHAARQTSLPELS